MALSKKTRDAYIAVADLMVKDRYCIAIDSRDHSWEVIDLDVDAHGLPEVVADGDAGTREDAVRYSREAIKRYEENL